MSRIANNPITIPEKIEVAISAENISVKGPLGELKQELKGDVKIENNMIPF